MRGTMKKVTACSALWKLSLEFAARDFSVGISRLFPRAHCLQKSSPFQIVPFSHRVEPNHYGKTHLIDIVLTSIIQAKFTLHLR